MTPALNLRADYYRFNKHCPYSGILHFAGVLTKIPNTSLYIYI